jgi:hypothetical protein
VNNTWGNWEEKTQVLRKELGAWLYEERRYPLLYGKYSNKDLQKLMADQALPLRFGSARLEVMCAHSMWRVFDGKQPSNSAHVAKGSCS